MEHFTLAAFERADTSNNIDFFKFYWEDYGETMQTHAYMCIYDMTNFDKWIEKKTRFHSETKKKL